MLIEGPNQQPQDTKGGDNETQEDSHKSAPEAPPPTAPPNLPVAASDEYDSYEGKNYRLSQKQFVAAKITLIVLAIYTGIAGYQAWKMRQATGAAITQTQLLSAQLKGTMSATVRLEEPRFTPDPVTQELTLVILFINGGHIIAPKTNAALRIETLSFPDLKTVLNSRTEMLTINEFGAGGSYSKLITVHDFPGPDRNFISQTKTIRVSGTFSYDNGFGDQFQEPICHAYIGRYNLKNEGYAGSTGGGDGFYPCDRFNELVPYILK